MKFSFRSGMFAGQASSLINRKVIGLFFVLSAMVSLTNGQGVEGYYRFPALHEDTLVFSAEGDLWTVPVKGGLARRLTSHPGEERNPQISPDGKTLAFTATYEGPMEVYTMPLEGGLPIRRTYQAESSVATTWTPDGKLVYTTQHFSTLPNRQLVAIDTESNVENRIPLSQASEGNYDDSGETLFFVRPPFHGNVTKRYSGGTARQIWSFKEGDAEAVKLTTDHVGESHHPMWWKGRVYFVTDRDGTMNLWSMKENGSDLEQHTEHLDFDVRQPYLNEGRIVYHRAGDLWLYDVRSKRDQIIPIRLVSDLDQLRENWVEKPTDYITNAALHPEGEKVALTARGRVFVVPVKSGRLVQISRKPGVRYRDAVFSADGEKIITLSDESSEFEFVEYPADGIGEANTLTDDGEILRFEGKPSHDGKWLSYSDLNNHLWLLEMETGEQKIISTNNHGIDGISWSPDSQWISFVQYSYNTFRQIHLYSLADGSVTELTSDRANSFDPVWHPDGEWLYFLSDRNFKTLVGSPWGPRQPEPYFDRKMKLFHLSLQKGLRSPFRPDDELVKDEEEDEDEEETESKSEQSKEEEQEQGEEEEQDEETLIAIDLDGIQRRVQEVPIPAGNYGQLHGNDKALFFTKSDTGIGAKTHLMGLEITNEKPKPEQITSDIRNFQVSQDGEKLAFLKGNDFYVINATPKPASKLDDSKLNLSQWSFPINVREDWRQIFTDAWRMERDYFYDPGMHGVDWDAMHEKYLPLVDRVTTRDELSDLIGRMVGELSALHTSVRGGDLRDGPDDVGVPTLGGRLVRDPEAGGYRIDYIYQADPDYPNERSPLDHPELDIEVGDVIVQVNGVDTLSARAIGELLRNQNGKQVRLSVRKSSGEEQDAIVIPKNNGYGLRYDDWEYTRRLKVETLGDDKIGYVHLQSMVASDLEQWYREFYPIFDRPALIVDVRHNRGGNIESFILEKLMRTAWMYWKNRDTATEWNMQYAFRGHILVLCNELTASDGEAFAEGFQRLELGKVLGTRTWGGEIWLHSGNRLSDNGIARAPMMGVYGPEGKWLVEQVGVIPDIELDNLPYATFNGQDAQLEAGIEYLLKELEKDPREVPEAPEFPDLSFENRPEAFRK